MKATRHPFAQFAMFLLSTGLICTTPAPARAGGDGKDAPPTKPRPDREKRIYTNDDFAHPVAGQATTGNLEAATVPVARAQSPARAVRAGVRVRLYVREADTEWYAQQIESLSQELASLDADAQYLRQFWGNGYAPGTGLTLNAPCEGIGTGNRIAQLDERRREIAAQIDELGDTAHRNDLPPGIFLQAAEILQASRSQVRVTPESQRAALRDRLDQANAELAQTRGIVAGMQADTAARSMSLLQPTGSGANMTTDLLQRLNARAGGLQAQISSLEDDARRSGTPPGFLR